MWIEPWDNICGAWVETDDLLSLVWRWATCKPFHVRGRVFGENWEEEWVMRLQSVCPGRGRYQGQGGAVRILPSRGRRHVGGSRPSHMTIKGAGRRADGTDRMRARRVGGGIRFKGTLGWWGGGAIGLRGRGATTSRWLWLVRFFFSREWHKRNCIDSSYTPSSLEEKVCGD
jgi:hypothetical protein